jgi:hypothetical protein
MAVLLSFTERHGKAGSRTERSRILREFADLCGLSLSAAYRKIGLLKRGHSPVDLAAGRVRRKTRKSQGQLALERDHALTIAGLYQGHYGSTEHLIMVAENMGLLPRGLYSDSAGLVRMNRILRREGLNRKSTGLRSAAWHLTADYPGHVFVVDATPLNHYYLRLDGKIVPYDLPRGDTHAADLLAREKLYKIWVYYLVDMYSRSYLVRAFAPEPTTDGARMGGENAQDWLTFLKLCLLPKRELPSPLEGRQAPLHDCPIEGVPDILFADRGSGIGGSSLIARFMGRLGAHIETHTPGNPSAKGLVESRIGASKRGPESILNRNTIKDINQLNYFLQAWSSHICRKRGFYDKWQRAIKERPVRRITEQNIQDALVSNFTRVVSNFGEVQIDSNRYFVSHSETIIGQKIAIYMPAIRQGEERRYVAELPDGTIAPLVDIREHSFTDIKSNPQSQGAINRDEARIRGKQLARQILYEDTLPPEPESKVLRFPNPARAVETTSLVPPQAFETVEAAMLWVHRLTRLNDAELLAWAGDILNSLQFVFREELKLTGQIRGDSVILYSNQIIEKHRETTNEATVH